VSAASAPAWILLLGLRRREAWIGYAVLGAVAGVVLAAPDVPPWLRALAPAAAFGLCLMLRWQTIRFARAGSARGLALVASPERLHVTIDGAAVIDASWDQVRAAGLVVSDTPGPYLSRARSVEAVVLRGPDGREAALYDHAFAAHAPFEAVLHRLHEHRRIVLEP